MPINEIETHPYLSHQVQDFTDKKALSTYCKLIVGTFPIYAITTSDPTEVTGEQIRAEWTEHAFMQYFYGSNRSHFWEFFATAFDGLVPATPGEAVNLLNEYEFLITDIFSQSERNCYSPSDNDLTESVMNESIIDILQNSHNLKTIYFTSKIAKRRFYQILGIPFYNNQNNNEEIIFGTVFRMVVLPSPAGNGRMVSHFFNYFPLSPDEENNRINGDPYAKAYRQRYYTHHLTMPID